MATLPSTPPPGDDPGPVSSLPGTFRALRHYNYQLFFFGQLVSLTGSWVQTAALTWLAYALTGQSRWPALVSAAHVLPTLLLGVWGGGLADRLSRWLLIFLSQLALLLLALFLTGLVAFGLVSPWSLLVVSLFIGLVNAIDTPARLAFVIDMVGREDLINAIALNSLVFNVARAAGPAIAGVFLPRVGAVACFLLNAVTFLAVLAALLAMRLPTRVITLSDHRDSSFLDGFRHLGQRRDLVLLVVLAGALAFFGWPMLSLLPAVASQQLDAGSEGYSWMLSAIGTGALMGALTVASYGTPERRRYFLLMGVVLGIVSLLGLALVRSLPLAVLCCICSGAGLILFFATGQAAMQLGADEHNRGRIMGIWLMVLSGAQPAGNLVGGLLADRLGVSNVLGMAAAGIALAGLVVVMLAHPAWPRRGTQISGPSVDQSAQDAGCTHGSR